jgi:hypothetical protein
LVLVGAYIEIEAHVAFSACSAPPLSKYASSPMALHSVAPTPFHAPHAIRDSDQQPCGRSVWMVANPDRTAFLGDYFRIGGDPGTKRRTFNADRI